MLYNITYMWNLKNKTKQTSKQNKKKQIRREINLWLLVGRGKGKEYRDMKLRDTNFYT